MNRITPPAPLLPLLIGIVAGVLLGSLPDSLTLTCIPTAIGICLILFRLKALGIIMIGISIGSISAIVSKPVEFSTPPADDTVCNGTVTRIDDSNSGRVLTVDVHRMIMHGETIPVKHFNTRVTDPSTQPDIYIGDIISFSGFYRLPGRSTDLPLENDGVASAQLRAISLTCLSPPDSIRVTGRDSNLLIRLQSLRSDIVSAIARSGTDDATTAFLSAVIAGDDSLLDRQSRDNFASAGVAHVLALSGAHVAIITIILTILFMPLAMAGYNRMRWIAVMIALWIFAIITGLSPSVVRSVIMASTVIGAILLDRPRSSFNALCFAAILILIFAPASLYKVGFQLSFTATAAIILLSSRLNPFCRSKQSVLRKFGAAIAVTIAATVATAPIVAFHFHSLPIHFLLSNLLMAVAMPLLITAGIILVILSAFGIPTHWLADLTDMCYSTVANTISATSSLPSSTIGPLYFLSWLLIPIYISIAALFLTILSKKWSLAISTVLLSCFTIICFTLSIDETPERDLFITRETSFTNIIVHNRDTLLIMTTSTVPDLTGDSLEWVRRYDNFIKSRRINNILLKRINVQANSYRFSIDGTTVSTPTPQPLAADYLLITKDFRGDIVDLARKSLCDTILLSNDISKRRHIRYVNQLIGAQIPVRSLRDSAFTISSGR